LAGAAAEALADDVADVTAVVAVARVLVAGLLVVKVALAVVAADETGADVAVVAGAVVTGAAAVLPVLTVALAAPPQAARRGIARPVPSTASTRRRVITTDGAERMRLSLSREVDPT